MHTGLQLTPIQHLAVKYLGAGWSDTRVARELQLPVKVVKEWRKDARFELHVHEATQVQADLVEAMLVAGERQAAETLIEALTATSKTGSPMWKVRVDAALSLLDRAGQRGKAIDRQMIRASVSAPTEHDREAALRAALRDPGVRQWLQSTGQTERLLEAESVEVRELPAGSASAMQESA